MSFDRLVVVLTRPAEYQKGPEKLMGLIKVKYRKYPKYIERCKNRHREYNASLKEIKKLEQQKKVLVIRPSKAISISRMEKNPDRIQEQYDLGRKDALAVLDQIKKYLIQE